MTGTGARRPNGLPWIALVFTGLVIAVVVYVAKAMLEPVPPKRSVQTVTLIIPPPPPPMPEEKMPEPEIEEKVDLPPEPPPVADNEPPAGSELGVDADGGTGSDGFGLVGKKGGRDLLSGGPFAWYAGVLQSDLTNVLADNKRVRRGRYSVELKLWIAADGKIKRYELEESTGDPELDRSLKLALAGMERVREAPPEEMPQPVKLRITSRL